MRRKRRSNKKFEKQDVSESSCFICKDGGHLVVCDHKNCKKVYHPVCVQMSEEAAANLNKRWVCRRHSCFKCGKTAKLHCFGCKDSVCTICFKSEPFVRVRGANGFCNECLNLALLATKNVDVDSYGVKIDFKDRNTYECLFKMYWEEINKKIGLTLADLSSAEEALMMKEKCYRGKSNSVEDVINKGDQWIRKRKRTPLRRETAQSESVLETSQIAVLPNISEQQLELEAIPAAAAAAAAADHKEKQVIVIQIIESDDDDNTEPEGEITPESNIWCYVGPDDGCSHGPFSMSFLKAWSLKRDFGPGFKVWKIGDKKKEMLFTDALALYSP